MNKWVIGLVFLTGGLLAGCGPDYEFREFTFEDEGFAVEFPGQPKKSTQIPPGSPRQTIWTAEVGNNEFQVFHQRVLEGAVDFKAAEQRIRERMGGEILFPKEDITTAIGYKGVELEFRITKPARLNIVSRWVVANGAFYQAQVVGPNINRKSSDVRKFLGSFRIFKARESEK
ncbi:MAG: hypothetical protein ACFCD0_02130 [Gemmataceae bacterium]